MKAITSKRKAILYAILAAAFYAISSPVSKILLTKIPAALMAALLYLGAGLGMTIVGLINKKAGILQTEQHLTKKELPFTVGMVLLDIAAPIVLMIGLSKTTAANASLLNNFEIVATSVIALLIFKETIQVRVWVGILLVTIASVMISVEDISSFSISFGSVFILLACICWGLENNCTRMLSHKSPLNIVMIKGFGSGLGSLLIAILLKESTQNIWFILAALLLGFFSYGLSVFFYVYAQRELGAAKTSTYYAIAPFFGVAISLVMFREIPFALFWVALLIMLVGVYFTSVEV